MLKYCFSSYPWATPSCINLLGFVTNDFGWKSKPGRGRREIGKGDRKCNSGIVFANPRMIGEQFNSTVEKKDILDCQIKRLPILTIP